MKTITIATLLLGMSAFVACRPSNSSSGDTTAVRKDIDPKAKGGNTCLLAYAEKYDELLTKDMAAEAAGFPEDRAIVNNTKTGLDTKEYDRVQYEWDNGREKLVKQINMKTKAFDYIQLTGIRAMSLSEFQLSYRVVTDKDVERIETAIDDAFGGNAAGESEAMRKAQEKLDELGVSREQQKEMMKGFASSAQKMTEAFSAVEQLGDAAVWNANENRMYVFTDGVKFEIVAEVGEDGATNKAVAMDVARRILERCK